MRKLTIAPSVKTDLNAIVDYIAFTLCNPSAANVLLDEIENAYDILQERHLRIIDDSHFCLKPRVQAF